jgi:hypothetical protein
MVRIRDSKLSAHRVSVDDKSCRPAIEATSIKAGISDFKLKGLRTENDAVILGRTDVTIPRLDGVRW